MTVKMISALTLFWCLNTNAICFEVTANYDIGLGFLTNLPSNELIQNYGYKEIAFPAALPCLKILLETGKNKYEAGWGIVGGFLRSNPNSNSGEFKSEMLEKGLYLGFGRQYLKNSKWNGYTNLKIGYGEFEIGTEGLRGKPNQYKKEAAVFEVGPDINRTFRIGESWILCLGSFLKIGSLVIVNDSGNGFPYIKSGVNFGTGFSRN